jgi:hypothetical protein
MILPRVSTILKSAGLVDTSYMTEYDRDRGSRVHLACQYLDEGDLDRITLADDIRPRVEQYERFKRDVEPEILGIEFRVAHKSLKYEGHPDRLVEIHGRPGILDLKGPSKAAWQGVQLAAYAHAMSPLSAARWTLHLSDDKYALVEHTSRDDWNVFKAALIIHNWKVKEGV